MQAVNVTELRNHLHKYLSTAHQGTEIWVTLHGQVIAKIVPPEDTQAEALKQLTVLRKKCKVNDVISPIDESWDAEK
jgi:prevent-host-death family protein